MGSTQRQREFKTRGTDAYAAVRGETGHVYALYGRTRQLLFICF